MPRPTIERPFPDEYAQFYGRYIIRITEGDALPVLEEQGAGTQTLLRGVSESRGDFRYAPGKWSIREVIGHLLDTERIFAYRALRFARNDRTPLPGFEQDDFVRYGGFGHRPLAELLAELSAVRGATVALFGGLSEEALLRRGVANDVELSVRAVAFIIAGHERHHVDILRSRYL